MEPPWSILGRLFHARSSFGMALALLTLLDVFTASAFALCAVIAGIALVKVLRGIPERRFPKGFSTLIPIRGSQFRYWLVLIPGIYLLLMAIYLCGRAAVDIFFS
jgi:hypothetical protein